MKLSIKGVAFALAIVWGITMLIVGLGNLLVPDRGQEFLQVMASIYIFYHGTASIGQVIIGTLYGLVHGAAWGAIFAWLYNVSVARPAMR